MKKHSDEQGWRIYRKDNLDFISVTTILSNAVANPGLNNWFKNNTKNQIEKVQRETSSFGTECHVFFEQLMSGIDPTPFKPEHKTFINIFKEWMFKHDVRPSHLELSLASEKYGFAGTTDFVGQIDGKEVIADWKITKSYKITNGWQLAAYRLAMKELHGKEYGLMGVQFNRQTGEPKIFEYEHFDFVEKKFLNSLEVFKGLYFKKLNDMQWKWLHEDALEQYFKEKYGHNKPIQIRTN